MPDWSYHTIFKPVLFKMPPKKARNITFSALYFLAKMPFGSSLVSFLGHMEPPSEIKKSILGMEFSSPVGMDGRIDPQLKALPAMVQFGFGFVTIGPVTLKPVKEAEINRDIQKEVVAYQRLDTNRRSSGCSSKKRRSVGTNTFVIPMVEMTIPPMLIDHQLIPLIAHDRAGFGGALLSEGFMLLCISLWGFKEGERWIWWTLFFGGLPGFFAGIGTHFHIGYTDFIHLLPAYFLVILYIIGLIFSYKYLHVRNKDNVPRTTNKTKSR